MQLVDAPLFLALLVAVSAHPSIVSQYWVDKGVVSPEDFNHPAAVDDECMDDPHWLDENKDGCVVYAAIIKKQLLTMGEACGYKDSVNILSGNPQGAQVHCRVTCGTCPVKTHTAKHEAKQPASVQEMMKELDTPTIIKDTNSTTKSLPEILSSSESQDLSVEDLHKLLQDSTLKATSTQAFRNSIMV